MNDAYTNFGKQSEPRRFYFYRVAGDDLIEYRTTRKHNVPWASVRREVDEILSEIASGALQPTGTRRFHRVWKRRNYFVIYFESDDEHLTPGNAVMFDYDSSPGGNHTFRDGNDLPKVNGVSIFYCINHMKRSTSERDDEDETFTFTLSHSPDRQHGGRGPRTHNDSGTNTGPP